MTTGAWSRGNPGPGLRGWRRRASASGASPCVGQEHPGIVLDHSANAAAIGYDATIHAPGAPVAALVIAAHEERAMARQVAELLSRISGAQP